MAPLPSSTRTMTYAPVASAGPFPVDFPVFDEDGVDLKVTVDAIARTDWTFTGTLESGFYGAPNTWINGEITFDDPITGALVIKGRREPRRPGQYAEGRGIPARDHNTEYNLLTAVDQELRRDVDEYVDRLDELDEAVSLAQAAADLSEAAADVSIAASAVAVDAAADAQAALAQLASLTFNIRADLEAATVPALVKAVRTAGYSAVGDGGGATFVRVTSEPSHVAKVRSTDRFMPDGSTDAVNGGWWVIVTSKLYSRQVGVHLSASAAETALEDFLTAAVAIKARARVNRGDVYDFPAGSVDMPEGIDLDWRGASFRRTVDLTVPLLQAIGSLADKIENITIRGGKIEYTAATTDAGITNSTAIWIDDGKRAHVERVVIEGAFYIGIYFRDVIGGTIDRCETWGLYNRGIYVAANNYTEDVYTTRCICDGYQFGTTTRLTNHIVNVNGFGTGFAANIVFTDVVARHGSISPTGEGFAVGDRMFDVSFVNCRVEDCENGFYAAFANGQAAQQVQYTNCRAASCKRGFYVIGPASLIQYTNCRSMLHSITGFRFDGAAEVHLDNCLSSGDAVTAGCDGFLFENATSGATLTNCRAKFNLGTGFKSTGTCTNIVGRGCATSGNGTATDMLGASGIDFPTAAGSGNLIA